MRLSTLSPGPQRRHRGRLQRVSLRRDARGRGFHVSAKRELTLKRNRQLDTKNVAASTRRAWSNNATQHRGCVAASPRTARGRRCVGAASEPRAARTGPRPRRAPRRPTGSAPPRGLFFFLTLRRAPGARRYSRIRLRGIRGPYRGEKKNNVSTYRRAKGHTHRVRSHGGATFGKKTLTHAATLSLSLHDSAGHQVRNTCNSAVHRLRRHFLTGPYHW